MKASFKSLASKIENFYESVEESIMNLDKKVGILYNIDEEIDIETMNTNVAILKELELYNPVNKKIRLGRQEDCGYVIVDGYDYDYFISCGIGHDITFEEDFMKKYPHMQGLAFDSNDTNFENLPTQIKFIETHVGWDEKEKNTNLREYVENHSDIFIKMDIEGSEWNWIKKFDDLFVKVKQFVFEGHNLFGHSQDTLECLRILNRTHYLVHVHENNAGDFIYVDGHNYPSYMEFTFIRKDCEINGFNTNDLPLDGIDFPCYPTISRFTNMNHWPFKI